MKMEIMKLNKIIYLLEQIDKNFQDSYVVGGILRDILLDKDVFEQKIVDIDLIIKNLDSNRLKDLIYINNLPFVVLDEENQIYRTVVKFENYNNMVFYIDFANYFVLFEDLKRRDFTINSLCVNLKDFISFLKVRRKDFIAKKIIHNFNSAKDIKNRIIRIVEKKNFEEDPLRILRLARFIACGFKPDRYTEKYAKIYSKLLKKVSIERISEELKKIFNVESYKVLEWMDKNKILEEIFPDIRYVKLKGKNTQFRKFYFHPEGLWQHIKLTYKSIEKIIKNLKSYYPLYYKDIIENLKDKLYLLKYVVLFHDIAKPLVVKKIGNRVRFFNHEIKSADIAKNVLHRLKLSNEDIKIITDCIKNHMRLGNLCSNKDNITERAYLRLVRDTESFFYILILFSLADRMSYENIPLNARKKYFKKFITIKKFIEFTNNVLMFFKEYKFKTSLPKLIDGNEVMKLFSLQPGPLIGKLLSVVREAQMVGKIDSKEEAVLLIKKYLKNHKIS
ncbi:MAG: HD domain-containing protein [Endomicrobia bacterium]|nr:HD domain-containing protein [Endomicrobiia bacterium]